MHRGGGSSSPVPRKEPQAEPHEEAVPATTDQPTARSTTARQSRRTTLDAFVPRKNNRRRSWSSHRGLGVVCDKNREMKTLAAAALSAWVVYPVFVVYEHGVIVDGWNGAPIGGQGLEKSPKEEENSRTGDTHKIQWPRLILQEGVCCAFRQRRLE